MSKFTGRLASHVVRSPELADMCENARRVKELCDAFGIEFRGYEPFVGLLQGADKSDVTLAQMVEDPDLRPFIWDLPE